MHVHCATVLLCLPPLHLTRDGADVGHCLANAAARAERRRTMPREGVGQLAQADEPDWSWEASVPPVQTSPRVRRMWQQYLEMQGISPPALGHTSWEGVLPIGRGSAGGGFGALILPSCTYLSHH